MCEALDLIRKKEREKSLAEGEAKGKAEGLVEGKAEGRAEGKAEGLVEGELIGKIRAFAELVKEGVFSQKEGARRCGISEEAFVKYL